MPTQMPLATHFIVIPFLRTESGKVRPGPAKDVPNSEIAWRQARALAAASGNIGAVVLAQAHNKGSADPVNSVVLASFGEVDLKALPL